MGIFAHQETDEWVKGEDQGEGFIPMVTCRDTETEHMLINLIVARKSQLQREISIELGRIKEMGKSLDLEFSPLTHDQYQTIVQQGMEIIHRLENDIAQCDTLLSGIE